MSSVSFVAGKPAAFGAPATSVTLALPTGIQDNDGVFAFFHARSAVTVPSGWTLITSVAFNSSGVTQTLYLYQKDTVTAADSGASLTWSQATSANIGVTYAVVRGSSGLKPVVQQSATAFVENTGFTVTPVALTADRDGEIILTGASTVLASASAYTPTPPTGQTLFSGSAIANYRTMGAYQARNTGQSNGGTWVVASGSSTVNGVGAISVRIVDAAGPVNVTPVKAAGLSIARNAPVPSIAVTATPGKAMDAEVSTGVPIVTIGEASARRRVTVFQY